MEEVTRLGDGGCCFLGTRPGARTATNPPGRRRRPRHTAYGRIRLRPHTPAPAHLTRPLLVLRPLALQASFFSHSTQHTAQGTMDPPSLGALDLSDSDNDADALFDTPAARKASKTKDGGGDAQGAAGGKPRAKESHYTAEEARESALRRELESIRNVNKVIEGVIESLQKAKDNMGVRH